MTASGTGPAPSPTRCSTRATCSTPIARPRARTSPVGSSGCWGRLAADAGFGEDDTLSAQFLVDGAGLTLVVRFLQLQHRGAERDAGGGRFEPVDELTTPSGSWLSWDEAIEVELPFGPFDFADSGGSWTLPVTAPSGSDIEAVDGGRLVRSREASAAS